MLFLTPLFLQIRICTRFCYTWELSHFKGLLKQKHYPQRTYLRLTFNYCLQCTGDLDKRWHIASRSIHSIHLYGLLITYQQNNSYIFIYLCLVHPSPHHPYYIHSILSIIYLVSTWLRFFTRNIKHRIIFRCLKKISEYIFEYLIKYTIYVLVSTLNNPYYKKKIKKKKKKLQTKYRDV